MSESPYLNNSSRLADVIAAIQAMGTYKFYKLDFRRWSDRITGDSTNAAHWKKVIVEHPEFFRLDSSQEKASLVIRRQHQRVYDVDAAKNLTRNDVDKLSDEMKSRLSRNPLEPQEISTLINTAIELHARAIEESKDRRWWLPVLTAIIGAASVVAGTVIS